MGEEGDVREGGPANAVGKAPDGVTCNEALTFHIFPGAKGC